MRSSSRRILRSATALFAATVSAILAAPAQATAGAAAAPSAKFHHYVALGDSYSAVGNFLLYGGGPVGCARSAVSYPFDLETHLGGATFADAACGSAVTADMTGPQSVVGGTNPAQFDSLTADTDLVTVGIGGNDIGFGDIITTCAKLSASDAFGDPCRQHFTAGGVDQLAERVKGLAPKIDAVLQGIRQRSPQAKIVLVGYLPVLPSHGGCWPSVPVSVGDVPYLYAMQRQLNDMLTARAGANGAVSVNPNSVTGRDACQAPRTRWVEPVVPAAPTSPVHPNQAGQAAVAEMIRTALGV